MAGFLWRLRRRLSLYITLHSYGQYWLTPWGYTYRLPADYRQMVRRSSSCLTSSRVASALSWGSSCYPTSCGVDVLDKSPPHTLVLRQLSSYAVYLLVLPSLSWPVPLPRPTHVGNHHSFPHITLFSSRHMTKSPQRLFLHFLWYFSHFRNSYDSLMSDLVQFCYSIRSTSTFSFPPHPTSYLVFPNMRSWLE